MLFGISFNEVFLIAIAVTFAGGYKQQFLQYSRVGGVFVGRAVGYVRKKRDQVLSSSTQRKELSAVQRQLGDALGQLNTLRHEIRGQSRIIGDRSGDMMSASELQDVNQAVLQNEARGATTSSQEQPSVSSSAQGAAFAGRDGAHIPTQEGLPFDIADPLSVRSGSASAAAGPSAADVDGLTARQRYEQLRIHDEHGKMVHIAGVALIPVSAAAAGRLEARQGPVSGSDIAVDALAEQDIARQAAAVFSGGP